MKSTGRDDTLAEALLRRGRVEEDRIGAALKGLVAVLLLTIGGGATPSQAAGPPARLGDGTVLRAPISPRVHALLSPVAASAAHPVEVVPRATGPRPRVRAVQREKSPVWSPEEASAASSATGLSAAWWIIALLAGAVGAGAVGLLYWVRVRKLRRQMETRTEELREEKQQAEETLEQVAEQADKLEEMSEAKSRFLKELSHAFRTPLTLTLGPIDNLLEGKHGTLSDEAQTQLRLAQRNGTRLLWLVNQLLDLAEIETGNMTLEPVEGNLVQFVAKGLWSFEGLAERRDVRLGFESALEDPMLWFDKSKMERVLANLLSGVFRSVEKGGAIRVKVRPVREASGDGDHVELVVEGTGTDFPMGDPEEPTLGRGDELWESGDVTTRIGLYLVEKLVDLHDGHVRIDDQAGEEDLRFIVRVPRQPEPIEEEGEALEEERVPRVPAQKDPGALTLSRKALSLELKDEEPTSPTVPAGDGSAPEQEDRTTVLVIDDNSVVCTLVRSHLEPDYRVEEAHEGAAGYNLATTLLPDLVIADVMMPEMDGFELCRKIKQDPDIDHIPVIFLTARADLEDKIEGLDVGADAYLTKPFEPEELIAHVENLIATRRSLRESFREDQASPRRAEEAEPGVNAEGMENAEEALPPTAGNKSLKERIEETIAENLTDPEFGVSGLAASTALSSSQLRRRMKEMYDRTPVQLIRRRRLEAGARLLRERSDATIGEVAYAVGFNSQSYFSRSFRDEFGTSPSRYRSQHEGAER